MNTIAYVPSPVSHGPAHWFRRASADWVENTEVQASRHLNLRIEPGQVAMLDTTTTVEVRCRRGSLWLTEYGRGQDIVLHAGQTWLIEAGTQRVAMSALNADGPACITLTPHGRGWSDVRIGNRGTRLRMSLTSTGSERP